MVRKRKSSSRKAIRLTRTRSTSKARTRGRGKTTRAPRYVYYFGDGRADGTGAMKPLLGGKGANLHEMTRIGLPVPPGFTIITALTRPNWKQKFPRQWPKSKNRRTKNLATRSGLYSFLCARARGIRCRA